ncbi:MAG: hypothetical protein IOC92_10095 [Rhodobacter sp.]|nr:hypothetical protein [Rhodobacter sp.]MCA3457419.1 hypothetical protein [Rhodobacter sp.]MCA3459923.1 hypothetical protein [Rhodobacter sp.]MCA3462961.1 hypothetical protein [Rhodobacter sp.]MCA3466374.1 hypothetical protein [Rhodobacter sp.]
MRRVVRVLACCGVLAGCAGAEAEVAMKAVDFSKPVPPRIFFVECGPLEGITMYPVPLAGKYTVEGKYRLSSSVSDLSVMDYSVEYPGDDRTIVEIPNDLDSGVNANFFVHGLANGCTGVFAATRVYIILPERVLATPSEHGITHSSVVDDVYLAFEKDPKTKEDIDRNGLFINVHMYVEPRSDGGLVGSVASFLLFEGNAYATNVVR